MPTVTSSVFNASSLRVDEGVGGRPWIRSIAMLISANARMLNARLLSRGGFFG